MLASIVGKWLSVLISHLEELVISVKTDGRKGQKCPCGPRNSSPLSIDEQSGGSRHDIIDLKQQPVKTISTKQEM